jgi:hypothetical protein
MLPPPHDLEAEEIVLSAVLWGDATAHALGLGARQLWAPEHGQLWAVLLSIEELGCERLAWGAWRCGLPPGPACGTRSRGLHFGAGVDLKLALRVVVDLPDWPPDPASAALRFRDIMRRAPLWGTVEDAAARVRELSRQRWLIRHMQRIEHLLRCGERPSERLLRGVAAALENTASSPALTGSAGCDTGLEHGKNTATQARGPDG